MSKEMAIKKKEEIEEINKQEAEDRTDMREDICPHCGTRIMDFNYMTFEPVFGWLECPACGVIFCPSSIRKIKNEKSSQTVQPASALVLAKG